MKRFIGIAVLLIMFISGFVIAEEQGGTNPPTPPAAEQAATPAPAAPSAAAVPAPKIDTGDTAWMIVATALVMLMTLPGLALFYGGLAKRKDTLNTMAMSFVTYCIVSFLWVAYGFSLS
ncbi:MAG TPA: ammonia channel protein, partial [Thermodesulfovibrionales bacterium]|nr:ammonia channel protein [Thermodesulfovibrionales bacterium]